MKRATQLKPDPTMLLVVTAIGVLGIVVARRYGIVSALRTVDRALGFARILRKGRSSAARSVRQRQARRVRPQVLRYSQPG